MSAKKVIRSAGHGVVLDMFITADTRSFGTDAPRAMPAWQPRTAPAAARGGPRRSGAMTHTTQAGADPAPRLEQRLEWVAQIVAIRDGQDQAAFAALFAHFAPRVKGFLMRSGSSAAFAEECTQEVLATVWRKSHLFDPAKASVATWVFTIARNRKIDMLRKERRPEPEDLTWGPQEVPSQAETMGMQQDAERLGRALADLPAKQRALIERAYYGDLSHSEIAAETGLPLGTIKSRIRLALDRLRHSMSMTD